MMQRSKRQPAADADLELPSCDVGCRRSALWRDAALGVALGEGLERQHALALVGELARLALEAHGVTHVRNAEGVVRHCQNLCRLDYVGLGATEGRTGR